MIPWLIPYAGIWAMTEPCARLMAIKVSALVQQATTVEQFAQLQAAARPDFEATGWPDFMQVRDGIAILGLQGVLSKERRQIPMKMTDWVQKLDAFLAFNEYEVLTNAGRVSAAVAKRLAEEQYASYRVRQDREFESDFEREVKRLKGKGE